MLLLVDHANQQLEYRLRRAIAWIFHVALGYVTENLQVRLLLLALAALIIGHIWLNDTEKTECIGACLVYLLIILLVISSPAFIPFRASDGNGNYGRRCLPMALICSL
ncbi:hypothetical protein ACLK1T_02745 [Escherichia coli]